MQNANSITLLLRLNHAAFPTKSRSDLGNVTLRFRLYHFMIHPKPRHHLSQTARWNRLNRGKLLIQKHLQNRHFVSHCITTSYKMPKTRKFESERPLADFRTSFGESFV